MANVGNVFIKRLQKFFFYFFHVFNVFNAFFYFYLNVYYIYGQTCEERTLRVYD